MARPLTETNPYLRDPETRRQKLAEDAFQSSVFEGARGLVRPGTPKGDAPKPQRRRSIASAKKSVKGA